MIIIVASLLLALFVVPAPWGLVLVGGAIVFEIAHWLFWLRFTKRMPPAAGREALIGLPVTVVSACQPEGRVTLLGERWRASCAAGAGEGDRLVVEAVEQITLVCRHRSGLADERAGGADATCRRSLAAAVGCGNGSAGE
jgi:membrane protein implicated in regulation of membrane protease activity